MSQPFEQLAITQVPVWEVNLDSQTKPVLSVNVKNRFAFKFLRTALSD